MNALISSCNQDTQPYKQLVPITASVWSGTCITTPGLLWWWLTASPKITNWRRRCESTTRSRLSVSTSLLQLTSPEIEMRPGWVWIVAVFCFSIEMYWNTGVIQYINFPTNRHRVNLWCSIFIACGLIKFIVFLVQWFLKGYINSAIWNCGF